MRVNGSSSEIVLKYEHKKTKTKAGTFNEKLCKQNDTQS